MPATPYARALTDAKVAAEAWLRCYCSPRGQAHALESGRMKPACSIFQSPISRRVFVDVAQDGPWLGFRMEIDRQHYYEFAYPSGPFPLIEAEIARRRAGALFQPGRHDRGWLKPREEPLREADRPSAG